MTAQFLIAGEAAGAIGQDVVLATKSGAGSVKAGRELPGDRGYAAAIARDGALGSRPA